MKRSENTFMTDPRLFKLYRVCITKSFFCSLVSIADRTELLKGKKKKQTKTSEYIKIVFAYARSLESTALSNHFLSWADYIGCRSSMFYVKG